MARESLRTESRLRYEPDGQASIDARFGFRDLKFGTPLTEISGMTFVGEGPDGGQHYARDSDNLTLGAAKLVGILYSFHEGKLTSVSLKASGLYNSQALREALQAAYGDGRKENRYLEHYQWWGERSYATSKMNSVTKETLAVIYDQVALEQRLQARKAAAAGADL